MSMTMALRAQKANLGSAQTGTQIPIGDTIQQTIIEYLRAISPRKTWAYLGSLIQADERTAKHRLAGTRRFSAEEIALLLRSEHGQKFLVAIMGDARPQWWTSLLRIGVLGGIQRRREADLRLLRRVSDADQTAAPEMAAALLLQDEDFYRPFIEAAESVARGNRGPVASQAGGRK